MNGMKLALQQKNSIQMIQIYKEKVMEIIRLSNPGYKIYKDDIDNQMNIANKSAWKVSSGGKSFLGLLFSSKEEKESLPSFNSELKKHNVTVGNIFILVVLPIIAKENMKNCRRKDGILWENTVFIGNIV